MADRSGQLLGNYRLIRLLGEGGFAEVYLGEHLYLGTEAAIKVLHTHLASDDWESFRKEARLIAGLVHPHIVRLLDFDVKEGMPFLVMAYAPNGTLRRRHPKGVPVSAAIVASYVRQVASALQYVHERKLIHRDVKPENLLVGADGEILLSDFGVAVIAQSSRQSNIQGIGGTVAYMAPEQIQSKPGAASDQYSLGVVVYEWLAGARPFDGSFTEMATKHLLVEPEPLRARVPTLAPTIEAVVLRALAKDPAQRFPSVQAFAQAFEQAAGAGSATLMGLQTPAASAIPLSPLPITPGTAPTVRGGAAPASVESLSTNVQVSLLIPEREAPFAVPSTTPVDPSAPTVYASPLAAPEQQKGRPTSPESGRGRLPRRAVLGGLIGLAGVVGGTGLLLFSQRPAPTPARGTPTRTSLPTPLPATQLLTYRGHSTSVYAVAWSPDGTRIASGSGAGDPKKDTDHTVQVWEAATGTLLQTYRGHTQAIIGLDWSPDSKLIASASYDGTVQVWEATTGTSPLVTYRGHSHHVWDVAWSRDGSALASCGADGTVQVWEASTGRPIYIYRQHKAGVASVDWSPLGSHLLSGSYDTTVQIWEAFTGTPVLVYTGHKDWVKSAVWSPDGKRVASGGGNNTLALDKDHSVQVWDAASGTTLLTYTSHPSPVFAIIWSPNGARIASCGADNIVRVWDATTAADLFAYSHHTNLVETLSWSPDGTRVVSGSDDKTAQVWWAS
jgi:serine/threonine protein kinase/Tol biopolymer transport system component